MTVVFVADEGVADSGFNATYQAVSVLDSEFLLIFIFNQCYCWSTYDHSFFSYFLLSSFVLLPVFVPLLPSTLTFLTTSPFFSDLRLLFRNTQHIVKLLSLYLFTLSIFASYNPLLCGFFFISRDMWSQSVCLQYRGVSSAAMVVWWMERLPWRCRWTGLWQLHLSSIQWVPVISDPDQSPTRLESQIKQVSLEEKQTPSENSLQDISQITLCVRNWRSRFSESQILECLNVKQE